MLLVKEVDSLEQLAKAVKLGLGLGISCNGEKGNEQPNDAC